MAADGSQERLLTSTGPRRFVPYGWSPDGSQVVASCEHGPAKLVSVCLLPLSAAPNAQDKSRIVASDPERNLYQPVFSPNQRWIAFDAVSRDVGVSTIYVVAVEGGPWTPISDGAFWDDKPVGPPMAGRCTLCLIVRDFSTCGAGGSIKRLASRQGIRSASQTLKPRASASLPHSALWSSR
jgi:Tol biopolymer transport system component